MITKSENTDKNILNRFNINKFDPHVEYNHSFILRNHQVIPKYYINSGASNSLILHYSLGSGKTAAAVFATLQYIKNNQNTAFVNQFLPEPKEISKICVIGSWQTQSQFEQELLKPELQLVTEKVMKEINDLINSSNEALHNEGIRRYDKIRHDVNKYVSYYGYQSFFKLLFDISGLKSVQNYNQLIEDFRHNRVEVSVNFINKFSNSIIIIDEMQRLYSYDGLNTYGLAAALLNSISRDYNIRIIYLTGTMFNTSIIEIESISCFFSKTLKFEPDNTKFISTVIMPGVYGKTIKPEFVDYYISMFKKCFAFYEQNNFLQSKIKPKIMKILDKQPEYIYNDNTPINMAIDNVEDNVYVPEIFKKISKNGLTSIVLPYTERLPHVIYIGNNIINDPNTEQPFVTLTVETVGYQDEKYTNIVNKTNITNAEQAFENIEEIDIPDEDFLRDSYKNKDDDDDDDESLRNSSLARFGMNNNIKTNESLIDLAQYAIPNNSNLPINRHSDGLYYSTLFKGESLREYSAIAYYTINASIDLAMHNEKTVIHTSRINDFGIEQYMYLFIENGCVEYGQRPKNNSICKVCGKEYHEHLEDPEQFDHEFKTIFITKLTGNQTSTERSRIVNNIYNIPLNVYGDIISILLISDVAYSGVSLFNTTNIMLICPVSNISKWRQIYSRIVRTNSHDMLPFEKQIAKVYTIVVRSSTEDISNCKQNILYKIKCILNEDVEHFIDKLSNNCVNQYIKTDEFNNNISIDARNTLELMFSNDIQDELGSMFKRIFDNSNSTIWSTETLLEKLKDINNSASYINFNNVPDNIIISTLLLNKVLEFDNFNNLQLTNYYKDFLGLSKLVDINIKRRNIKYELEIPFYKFAEIAKEHADIIDVETIETFKNLKQKRLKYQKLSEIVTKIFNEKWQNLFTEDNSTNEIIKYIYEIHDEYYEGDETNFVKNHSTNMRDISKVNGFYCNNKVIKSNGETLILSSSFNKNVDTRPTGKYIFKFITGTPTTGNKFSLYLMIIEKSRLKSSNTDTNDKRYTSSGINCETFNHTKLKSLLKNIDYTLSKTKFCTSLMSKICDFQLEHPDIKYIFTPFDTL